MMLDGWWYHWKCKDCALQMYSGTELALADQVCGVCEPTSFKEAAKRAVMWIDEKQGKMAARDKWLDSLDEAGGKQ